MSGKSAKRARMHARASRDNSVLPRDSKSYWHGGMPGLKPGDILLPMTELLALPPTARLKQPGYEDVDMSWVAMTTDRDLAEGFAERWSYRNFQAYRRNMPYTPDPWQSAKGREGGALYRVKPHGATSSDPDLPDVAIRARRAVIVAVEIESLPYTEKIRLAGLKYMHWDDGNRMYTEDGYGHPSALAIQLGVKPDHLRHLGYGPSALAIDRASMQAIANMGKLDQLHELLRSQNR